MKSTVVIYGHPHYADSHSNKAILNVLAQEVPEAGVVNLMELYPDYKIDVAKEQARLKEADVIVFEFPIFWYGMPSILDRYVEEVFTYGFAYGAKGNALQGKKLLISFTAGVAKKEYSPEGKQHHSMDEYLLKINSTAALCGLEVADTVGSFGMMIVDPADKEHNADVISEAITHGKILADVIKAM